jgi:hypothetical protein
MRLYSQELMGLDSQLQSQLNEFGLCYEQMYVKRGSIEYIYLKAIHDGSAACSIGGVEDQKI